MSMSLEPQVVDLRPELRPYGRLPWRPGVHDCLLARRAYEAADLRRDSPPVVDKRI